MRRKRDESGCEEEYIPHAERLFETDGRAINAFKAQDVSDFPDTEEPFAKNDHNSDRACEKNSASARRYAMYLVSATVCTERKLIDKLRKKGIYSDLEILDALDYVKSFGYINDRRLAQISLPRLAERLWGRSRICLYLKSRGISQDIIDSLDFSEIDFAGYCRRLAEKNAGKPYSKLMRTLINAGYTRDEIRDALGDGEYE